MPEPGSTPPPVRGEMRKTARLARLREITTKEMSDLCGVCHRTWAHIQINGPHGVGNVRFQPYRIAHSKCHDAVNRRIGCTNCHDPHNRPEKPATSYDAACKACHDKGTGTTNVPRMCKVGQRECVTCHMPKYEIPRSHFRFTDHFIRIVRANEIYPD